MRLAKEGWPFIGIGWAVLVLLAVFAPWYVALLWAPIAIWVVAFFRDPTRDGPRGDRLILAPADGEVVSVIPMHEPRVVRGQAMRISIFMNVFSVHVNRYPTDGTITLSQHERGKFFHAAEEKAATQNEHADTGVASPHGAILTRQIAGSVARRIVTDHTTGTAVRQGERMGLIRFGSRVDVFVPAGTRILVKEGDVTRAGVTVIAEWT